jgi:hypothetical protein
MAARWTPDRTDRECYPGPGLDLPVLFGDLDTNMHVNNVMTGRFFEESRVDSHFQAGVPAMLHPSGPAQSHRSRRDRLPASGPVPTAATCSSEGFADRQDVSELRAGCLAGRGLHRAGRSRHRLQIRDQRGAVAR